MFKEDLKTRIAIIKNLEHQILQEPIRFHRLKKLNQLMFARDNLRLQFYTEHVKDMDMLTMLETEAKDYISFQGELTTRFGKSNTEFSYNLQSILDTCEQTKFLNSQSIITTSHDTLERIDSKTRESKNIMTNYRLRQITRCRTLLNQFAKENIENKPRSLDCCTDLNADEIQK